MSRQDVAKISTKNVERKRVELNSQRALLQRTLRDVASIDDAMDMFLALQLMLYPPGKKVGHR